MRDEDKPFVMYRSGMGSIKIVPRNAAGWRQMIIWIALNVPITGLLIWFATIHPEGTALYAGLALYLVAMLAWGLGGMLWMRARAEVVDLDELLKLKREQDRKRRGR